MASAWLASTRAVIRTAEDFDAVDWATGFSNKHGCIVGLLKETDVDHCVLLMAAKFLVND